MTRRAGSAGFTLLELLVVLVVIGLAGVVAFPAVAGRSSAGQARVAARDLVTALRATRAEAVAVRRPVAFQTSPRVPAGVRVERADGGQRPVTFFPDGGSTGGRFLVQPGGIAVEIDWLSGAVRQSP